MSTEPGFPDVHATVEPLLAVTDLSRSLTFWQDQMGGLPLLKWDSYALLQLGAGRLHLAVTGVPPKDRAVPAGAAPAGGHRGHRRGRPARR